MSTGAEHGQLNAVPSDWFCHQPIPPARMTPWTFGSTNGFQQACAVPFRKRGKRFEFCLITSSSGRWMFPKGLIDRGDTPAQTARKEALEEAGLHGHVSRDPLGWYAARKHGRVFSVLVLLMEVRRSDDDWKEDHFRERCWVTVTAARKLLEQQELRDCLEAALARLGQS